MRVPLRRRPDQPGAGSSGSFSVLRCPTVTPDHRSAAYRLTPDQLALRDAVRELARARVAPRAAETDRTATFPEDLRQLLATQDILALPFPEAHGGIGADLLTVCLAIEELSAACATTGLILAAHELGALPILLAGSDEQQARWLPDLASGRRLVAFALTEAGAGSDAGAIATRAVRDGDEYVLDGSKRFITHGSIADLVVVFALTDPKAARHRNLSVFVVERGSPGFSIGRLEHKMGIRGSPTAELLFDGVRIPASDRIGDEGEGFSIAMRTFDRSRPGIAAQAVGIAQGALDVATQYARERVQFGRPIGEFQLVQGLLADMDAATEAARALLYTACAAIDAGDGDPARWAALCKLVAGDAAMRVTTDAVQVLGGYGYVEEFPVERMMRDAKITQLYEGTQQIQRLVIARSRLARG
jgi:alkylation response protein AidB-like acyl-CoA dehydrogenase